MRELIEKAKDALLNSYCPYSKIKVGAALMTKEGKIYTGCNIENASYGLTVCAERVALGCAIASGEKQFKAIAIVNSTERIFKPCGACRQVLAEFAPELEIILVSSKGKITKANLKELLPNPFKI